MTERLWVDDLRPAPDGWTWAKSSSEAIALLEAGEHDRRPPEVRVHTADPVGRAWLTGMARRYGPGVR